MRPDVYGQEKWCVYERMSRKKGGTRNRFHVYFFLGFFVSIFIFIEFWNFKEMAIAGYFSKK